MRHRSFIRLSLLVPLLACSSATAPGIEGAWGGTDASLVLTRGGGTIQYACGDGTIDSAWTLSANGQFAATGRHYVGGGPVLRGGRPPHPSRYDGRVAGSELLLTVTLADLGQTLGPYQLVRGGAVVSELCL